MNRFILLFIAVLLFIFPLSTHAAADLPLDSTHYPSGMALKIRPHVSNNHYECWWAYDCDSHTPLFHTTTPLDAQRISGWVETATAPRLSFVLLDSLFPSTTEAQASLDDEQATTIANGFYLPKSAPATGGYFGRIKLGTVILTLYVVVVGTHLIEGAEWDKKQSLPRSVVTRYLLGQVAAASALDMP